ncbi:hypothetical protein HK104_005814, partial [Borealophlyctis nickersoniae]
FLIQGDNGTVLYTGDLRADSYFLDGIRSCRHLLNADGEFIDIRRIYLDTTFARPSHIAFPSKEESVTALIDVLRGYDSQTCFRIKCNILGYEPLWIGIANAFRTQVYVSPARYDLYDAFAECTQSSSCLPSANVLQYLMSDPESTRFHGMT